jgi:signal transduction histidine kinase
MSRLFPKSLFGQMLLILLAGLVVSHAIGAWLYWADREAAVREVGGLAAAQRIANLTRLVEDAPEAWRERIVVGLSDPAFRVALSFQAPAQAADAEHGPVADAIRAFLIDRLALGADRRPLVAAAESARQPFVPFADQRPILRGPHMMEGPGWMGGGRGGGPGRMMGGGPGMMGGPGFLRAGLVALDVAIPLSSGQWLSFSTALPEATPFLSRQFIVSMLVMAAVLVGVAVWAARRVTKPLGALAEAAQRLGRDVDAPPIAETGSVETRQAARAFNDMQTRLRELIENRTRLLAAISHDLRTPLTLLRLRTEHVAEGEDKDKMLATIAEMNAMVGATLQYARDELSSEPVRRTDLTALVQSVADDMADAGFDVAMTQAPAILLDCRPAALKRAVTNLVDNAVKYGKAARIALRETADAVEITIDDEGPGLPEEELARVFHPFYRVEGSRSRDTGGVGLGLAIARSLVERHRGTLVLTNRETGGLRAQISLPR